MSKNERMQDMIQLQKKQYQGMGKEIYPGNFFRLNMPFSFVQFTINIVYFIFFSLVIYVSWLFCYGLVLSFFFFYFFLLQNEPSFSHNEKHYRGLNEQKTQSTLHIKVNQRLSYRAESSFKFDQPTLPRVVCFLITLLCWLVFFQTLRRCRSSPFRLKEMCTRLPLSKWWSIIVEMSNNSSLTKGIDLNSSTPPCQRFLLVVKRSIRLQQQVLQLVKSFNLLLISQSDACHNYGNLDTRKQRVNTS